MTERDPLSTPAVPGGLPFDASQIQFTQATVYAAGTLGAHAQAYVSVKDAPFNAVGDGVTDDTAAFNAAALASGFVFAPPGTYLLSALTAISLRNINLFGAGRSSILKFNTAGKGIQLGPFTASQQRLTARIADLAFTNVTNVPAAFISQENYVDALFERLYFADCAATYCIDNVSGYGTSLHSCVFSDVTGAALRLRDNGAAPNYSYAFGIDDCDFTRVSGNSIEVERALCLKISKSVIEGCGGKGIVTSTGASLVSQEIFLDTCYFETNTGAHIDLGTNGATYWGRAKATACFFNGGTIALGSKSKIVFDAIQGNGGAPVTVSGSANAEAWFHGCESANFTQSGTFLWSDPNKVVTYNPTITNVGTSAINGRYIRDGNRIVFRFQVTVTGAPTGVIKISLPYAAATSLANVTVGYASGIVAGVYPPMGALWLFDANTLEIHGSATGNEWSAAVPGAWANGNSFEGTADYFTA